MQGKLLYERSGSFLDRKRVELIASDIKQCVVLWFGLGDNLEPNRVQLKMRKGSLYIGRNLSKAQAEYFCGLLNRFVSNR
jgi:hypothetical protein